MFSFCICIAYLYCVFVLRISASRVFFGWLVTQAGWSSACWSVRLKTIKRYSYHHIYIYVPTCLSHHHPFISISISSWMAARAGQTAPISYLWLLVPHISGHSPIKSCRLSNHFCSQYTYICLMRIVYSVSWKTIHHSRTNIMQTLFNSFVLGNSWRVLKLPSKSKTLKSHFMINKNTTFILIQGVSKKGTLVIFVLFLFQKSDFTSSHLIWNRNFEPVSSSHLEHIRLEC